MSGISGASIYGYPNPATQTQAGVVGAVATPTSTPVARAGATLSSSWHQNPVLILVGLLAVAFLLARGAEHGLSFGFSTKVRAK